MTSTIKVDTIEEKTSANGVAIDSLGIKDGKITNLMNATLSAADLGAGVHIKTADSGQSAAGGNGDELVLESDGECGLSILSGASANGNIFFGDSGGSATGIISYNHANNYMAFNTNGGNERVRIDSSGNVGIGTDSPAKLLSLKKDGGGGAIGIDIHNQGTDTADDALITFETQGHRNFSLGIDRSASAFVVMSEADGLGTPRMTVDDDGRVGIATTTPGSFNSQAQNLVIGSGSGDAGMTIFSGSGSGDSGNIFFADGTSDPDFIRGGITYKHDDNSLIFRVDDSPTVTLDSSHNMIFDNSGSGVYLGVTSAAASNLLDDYEVGTFTPHLSTTGLNFTSIGYNTQTGEYVKVGDLVIAHARLTLNALTVGSPTGNAVVSGLPFTSKNTTDMASSIGFVSNINFDISSFGTIDVGATTSANNTVCNLTRTRNNGTADGVPHQAVTSSSTDINIVAIYKTA